MRSKQRHLYLVEWQGSAVCYSMISSSVAPALRSRSLPWPDPAAADETHWVWLEQTPRSLYIPEVCILCWEHLKCQNWFIPNDIISQWQQMCFPQYVLLLIDFPQHSHQVFPPLLFEVWHWCLMASSVCQQSQQTPQLLISHLSDAFISKVTYSIFITGPVPTEWPEVKCFATSLTTKPPLHCSRRQNIHCIFVKHGHFRALILFPLTAVQRVFPNDLTA